GSIEGNVYSSKRVEMASNAVVCGDVHYQMIEMVKGAQINGGLMYTNATPETSASSGLDGIQAVDSDEVLGEYVDSGLNG
ncbi:MAG: polymer-forming cytoskeletal protein, partial [Pseudomonadales bacterium]